MRKSFILAGYFWIEYTICIAVKPPRTPVSVAAERLEDAEYLPILGRSQDIGPALRRPGARLEHRGCKKVHLTACIPGQMQIV
jgi:hypothetical protein